MSWNLEMNFKIINKTIKQAIKSWQQYRAKSLKALILYRHLPKISQWLGFQVKIWIVMQIIYLRSLKEVVQLVNSQWDLIVF